MNELTDKEKLDMALDILKNVHIDASMAIAGEWDCSPDGFESQQLCIEQLFRTCNVPIPEYIPEKDSD